MSAASDFRQLRRALAEAGRSIGPAEPCGRMDARTAKATLGGLRKAAALGAELEACGAMARAEAALTGVMAFETGDRIGREADDKTAPETLPEITPETSPATGHAPVPQSDTPPLSRAELRALLSELAPLPHLPGGQDRALARIVLVSAHVAGLEADALRGGFKDREVAQARQMAMCLCAALTQATYGRIGAALGGRDHKAVTRGIARAQARIEACDGAALMVAEVLAHLNETPAGGGAPCGGGRS
ncbi:helix-turn-helix domain-containing protein [Ruegeria sp.]|uniref:helix-turn-helix domain-containing protein n=1 Tax=Ruegeria sp. TaxID=1879320 RepID=UPI003B004BF1